MSRLHRLLRRLMLAGAVLSWAPSCVRAQACVHLADWQQLIGDQVARYPGGGIDDVLKLLLQATRGSEHAVPSEAEAAGWMQREWQSLDTTLAVGEPLIDTLGDSAIARYARVNLRPYKKGGGDPSILNAVFVETAQRYRGDVRTLKCALAALDTLAEADALPWPAGSVRARVVSWAAAGYPAVEHTPAYMARYHPSYRVVGLELVAGLLSRGRS